MKTPAMLNIAMKMVFTSAALLIMTIFFSAAITMAESHGDNGTSEPVVASLVSSPYSAKLNTTHLRGQVDTPLSIPLTISPFPPPVGTFYTSVVDVLEHPDGPDMEIVPGTQEIKVRSFAPGSYRLRVRVNLLDKTSCGGIDVDIIMEDEVFLDITD